MEAASTLISRFQAWRRTLGEGSAWEGSSGVGWVRSLRTEASAVGDDDASAVILWACADALQRMRDVPALRQDEHLDALERALQAVADRAVRIADPASGAAGPPVSEVFAVYRAVQHIAGAPRVHPADLWPCPDPWLGLPVDPFVTPRALDAGVLDELESTLLALLRQSGPDPSDRMSALCAALAERSGVALPDLWRLAAAVYEGQREGLIAADVYFKRVGPRLLALARELAAAPIGQHPAALSARMAPLAHELLFFCVHAADAGEDRAPRLAAVRQAYRERQAPALDTAIEPQRQPPMALESQPHAVSQPDAASRAAAAPLPEAFQPEALPGSPSGPRVLSLVQAVPGLPSMADLDLEAVWPDEEPAPEDIKQIGPLRIPIARFNGFLAESDELARRLGTLLDEWRVEAVGPPPQTAVEAAQALAVEAAAVGHDGLAALCAALADALQRVAAMAGFDPDAAERFGRAHGQLQRLLHTFAAGFLRPVDLDWVAALRDFAAGDDHPAASEASSGLPTHPSALAPVGNLDLSKGLEEPKASDGAQNLRSSPKPAIDGSQETGSGLESPESPEGPADAVVPDNPTEGARPSVSLARDPVEVGLPEWAVEHALKGLRTRLRDAGLNPDDILADLERAMAIGRENSTGRG